LAVARVASRVLIVATLLCAAAASANSATATTRMSPVRANSCLVLKPGPLHAIGASSSVVVSQCKQDERFTGKSNNGKSPSPKAGAWGSRVIAFLRPLTPDEQTAGHALASILPRMTRSRHKPNTSDEYALTRRKFGM